MAMYGDGWQFRLPGMGTVVVRNALRRSVSVFHTWSTAMQIATNPADVSHILSTNFDNYPKVCIRIECASIYRFSLVFARD